MAITEAQRFKMQVELRKILGDDVTTSLMEHLPPSGWADVARKSDVEQVSREVHRIGNTLKATISVGIAFGIAIIALQVQIMLSIAHL